MAGELKQIRYLVGDPLQYRFDGNTGIFRIGENNFLTRQGEVIKIHCLGFRIFKGRPFEQYKEIEVWTELYFLTENLAVACLLLRGASAIDFNRMVYYWGASPIDTVLELKPLQRYSKEHGKQYWVVEAQFTLHTQEEQAICDHLRDTLTDLFRYGLVTGANAILIEHNIRGCELTINHSAGVTLPEGNPTEPDPFAEAEFPQKLNEDFKEGNVKALLKKRAA